nr:uncharacterized protein LOC127295645 isoform X10 [Lolium perenne]
MAKIKSVNQFEQEFMEHIDVLRHAHGEGDNELETQISSLFYPLVNCLVQVYMKALADMRRDIKEKELNALLSGDRDPYPCFIERSEAHQPGLRLQRSCEDWRSNLPCIYQTESGIWGLHFNQKHASYVTSSQCSPELFHTNCLEGSQGELCHVIAMFTGAVSHKLLRRFSGTIRIWISGTIRICIFLRRCHSLQGAAQPPQHVGREATNALQGRSIYSGTRSRGCGVGWWWTKNSGGGVLA